MTRFRAAGIHLGISAFILLATIGVALGIWYPPPYFHAAWATRLLLLLAGVNLTLGPLLTLILFVPGKRGLLLDLWLIACLQIGTLGYGLWWLVESRPTYIVFAVDRFEVVAANQISFDNAKPPYDLAGYGGPVLVAAIPSHDAEGMKISTESMTTGIDIHLVARYYAPYNGETKGAIAHGIPIAAVLLKHPTAQAEIASLLASHNLQQGDALILPLTARQEVGSIFIRRADGQPFGTLWLAPW
jgi:hypothetical protein